MRVRSVKEVEKILDLSIGPRLSAIIITTHFFTPPSCPQSRVVALASNTLMIYIRISLDVMFLGKPYGNPTFRYQLVNSGILVDIKYFILDEVS